MAIEAFMVGAHHLEFWEHKAQACTEFIASDCVFLNDLSLFLRKLAGLIKDIGRGSVIYQYRALGRPGQARGVPQVQGAAQLLV